MSGINKVIIIGNLGQDPDMRYTPTGAAVCSISVATTESWNKDGQKQEKTEWHRVVIWNKRAEVCAKYLFKGSKVYIEGKLQTRSFEKDGVKKYITEIIATDVQFLTKNESGNQERSAPSQPQSNDDYVPSGCDEDIPF